MIQDTTRQFGAELNSFFIVSLFSMVFGALAMGIGMMILVQMVLAGTAPTALSLLLALTGCAGIVLGFGWIRTTVRILRGIKGIRREYRHRQEPVTEVTLTGWIVQMTAHYRENARTIRWMNGICLLGGCIYLAFGLQNLYAGIVPAVTSGSTGGVIWCFAAAAVNCTIGIVSIAFSLWFYRYSQAWDQRIKKARESESVLMQAMDRE